MKLRPPVRTAAAALALAAAALLPSAVTAAAVTPASWPGDSGGAVFVQTDAPDANAVVAYRRAPDGSLHRRGTFATGGRGGVLGGSVVDHLASQGSLAYDRVHRLLFAVNAGSDTVTVFSVHGEWLEREQVVPSGGDFPVSVTVRRDTVYVLNARDGGSVQGYRITGGGTLEPVVGGHRELGLDTAAAPEFTHTPGQVSFTPDGSRLVVTTKAGGSSIEVFRVRRSGALVGGPAVTAMDGAVPFGFTFDERGLLVVTDAGSNSVLTFAIRHDGHAVPLGGARTGQMATCWIVRAGDRFYASNAGSGTLSGFRRTGLAGLAPLGTTATGAGTTDSAVTPDERFLYVQTGATGGVDAFRVGRDGSLAPLGSVTVPDAVGGEGIVAL
ncbi:lactonase family protein [Streptomyces sp. NPDC021224]|uniref:lactonase family protein n=1 Tax=unclassified Streptomyces TaxID=2593676 RepID=UPI0037925102